MTDLSFLSFLSPRLVFTDALVEQYRFPRSKKRRIREKWAKKRGNWRPSTKVMMSTDNGVVTFYAHPSLESFIYAVSPQPPLTPSDRSIPTYPPHA